MPDKYKPVNFWAEGDTLVVEHTCDNDVVMVTRIPDLAAEQMAAPSGSLPMECDACGLKGTITSGVWLAG